MLSKTLPHNGIFHRETCLNTIQQPTACNDHDTGQWTARRPYNYSVFCTYRSFLYPKTRNGLNARLMKIIMLRVSGEKVCEKGLKFGISKRQTILTRRLPWFGCTAHLTAHEQPARSISGFVAGIDPLLGVLCRPRSCWPTTFSSTTFSACRQTEMNDHIAR